VTGDVEEFGRFFPFRQCRSSSNRLTGGCSHGSSKFQDPGMVPSTREKFGLMGFANLEGFDFDGVGGEADFRSIERMEFGGRTLRIELKAPRRLSRADSRLLSDQTMAASSERSQRRWGSLAKIASKRRSLRVREPTARHSGSNRVGRPDTRSLIGRFSGELIRRVYT
jgi:hypothetical protein